MVKVVAVISTKTIINDIFTDFFEKTIFAVSLTLIWKYN